MRFVFLDGGRSGVFSGFLKAAPENNAQKLFNMLCYYLLWRYSYYYYHFYLIYFQLGFVLGLGVWVWGCWGLGGLAAGNRGRAFFFGAVFFCLSLV